MANDFLTLIKALNRFQQLQKILLEGPEGQAARWDALQAWLNSNPDYKERVEHCLSIAPGEAVDYLCAELGIDLQVISVFDSKGELRASAEKAVGNLQQLYKERKGDNETTELHRIAAHSSGVDHADGASRPTTDFAWRSGTRRRKR